MECETVGTIGNYNIGSIIPINYITGLKSAELTEILIPAEDDEETEHLRERYFKSLNAETFGGNITDYKEKTNAISGVGAIKVTPVWNGGGTVKLVIINSEYSVPTASLIEKVQTIIDPVGNCGVGVGIAPIGHIVTIFGVQDTLINIQTEIIYQTGWTFEDVRPYIETVIDEYFKELATEWADNENLIVRISQIEIRLLSISGIIDISNTSINGVKQNFILDTDNIAVRGTFIG